MNFLLLLIMICLIVLLIQWFYLKFKTKIILKKPNKKYDHAIIIGGSIAGMCTVGYLKKYFHRITIIEIDDVLNNELIYSNNDELLNYRCRLKNSSSIGRSNVNQSYQIHILQGEGRNILFELFSKLEEKLLNDFGAYICSLKTNFRFVIGKILLNTNIKSDLTWFCLDRFTLETILRRELIHMNNIQWITNAKVENLIVDQINQSVLGVEYQQKSLMNSKKEKLFADWICDCSGRTTKSSQWLKTKFHLNIPEDQLHLGLGYLSFIVHRYRTGYSHLDSLFAGGLAAHAPDSNQGFLTIPIRKLKENEYDQNLSLGFLSNISIHCFNGEYPPDDSYEKLLQWVQLNLPSDYYLILKSSQLKSPLLSYRGAFDHRKYVEQLGKQWPKRFILIGDSMCSFNPKNGQGMTHACRQAKLLNDLFQRNSQLDELSWIYNRKASKITEECWLGSTTNDWQVSTLKLIRYDSNGNKRIYQRLKNENETNSQLNQQIPLFIRFLQWYTHWLIYCSSYSSNLTNDFLHVVFQHQSPFSLLKPNYFFHILYQSIQHYFISFLKIFYEFF